MLRDRLVCGVNEESIQRRLSHGDLDFDKAWEIAQSMETANRDVNNIQAWWRDEPAAGRSKPQEAVNRISDRRPSVSSVPDPLCFRCKGRHTPADCRFASETCHGCGKKGHIVRACRVKGKSTQPPSVHQGSKGRGAGGRSRRAHLVQMGESSSSEAELDMFSMYAVYMVGQKSHKVPPIQQSVTINGTEVTFEVYTGCSVTVLSRKQYVKLRALAVLPKLEACLVKEAQS